MQRPVEQADHESLAEFMQNVRQLMRTSMGSFPKQREEIDDIDENIGAATISAFKTQKGNQLNELLHREKGAQLRKGNETGLSDVQEEEKQSSTDLVYVDILKNTTEALEAKLMEKVRESKFKKYDNALERYIAYLNKNGNKDHVGRLLAATLKHIYTNQSETLSQDHRQLGAVMDLQLNPAQIKEYGFEKIGVNSMEKSELNTKARMTTTTTTSAPSATSPRGDLTRSRSGRFLGKMGLYKKDSRENVPGEVTPSPRAQETPSPRSQEKKVAKSFRNLRGDFFSSKKDKAQPEEAIGLKTKGPSPRGPGQGQGHGT